MAPYDDTDPADSVRCISEEMEKFSPTLAKRDRWLVLNKLDMVPDEEQEQRCQDVLDSLQWDGPVFRVSAIKGEGTEALCYEVMSYIEECNRNEAENPELAEQERQLKADMEEEARACIRAHYEARMRRKRGEADDDDDNFDDDDYDVEVEYVP